MKNAFLLDYVYDISKDNINNTKINLTNGQLYIKQITNQFIYNLIETAKLSFQSLICQQNKNKNNNSIRRSWNMNNTNNESDVNYLDMSMKVLIYMDIYSLGFIYM
jgi:hypothetical protein